MRIATPVDEAGQTAHAWGRAHWVAVADVTHDAISDWQVHEVSWDDLHDTGTHGSHHARIVTFMKQQGIQAVVVNHMGEGMQRVLASMSVPMLPASPGDAQQSVLAAVRGAAV